MQGFAQEIFLLIEWYHVVFLLAGILVLLVLRLVIQAFWHRYTHKLIWPVYDGSEPHEEMDVSDTIRQVLATSNLHITSRYSRASVVRGITWHLYLNLKMIRRKLSKVPAEIITMIPASLWLFENFHFIYRELKKFQETGGADRFRKLPMISKGKGKGYPRVYALAREILSCTHHLNGDFIRQILSGYQREHELTTAELWTFHNALILCLLEEIVLESNKIISSIETKREADKLLKRIIPQVLKKEMRLADLLDSAFSEEHIKDNVFLAHVVHRLRVLPVDDVELAGWLAKLHITEHANASDLLSWIVNREGRFEASSESAISTLITSLKSVGNLNWVDMFQNTSRLDAILSKDPAGMYDHMDVQSKAQYRTVIEKLAKKCHKSELQIADAVIRIAETNHTHLGYFLLGKGYYELLRSLSCPASRQRLIDKGVRKGRGAFYFAGIIIITPLILFLASIYLQSTNDVEPITLVILFILLIIPASDLAIFLINTISTRLFKPRALLSLDLTNGIPEEYSTYIVMPVILNNSEQIKTYAKRLEKHYLANRHNNLYFAILADYFDSKEEHSEADKSILEAGVEIVQSLNATYPSAIPRFNLFFRPRKWNESQNCWMGWERKRGKLEVFNSFLCGDNSAEIDLVVGRQDLIPEIRFVITLDSDTELLRDGAAELIGIMAHPLNKPVLDSQKRRVIDGYAIVQSEIRTRISTRSASMFSRFFSSQSGIDPYATIVSDVYQDLFDEGIFAGKGIYDLHLFQTFMSGIISENSVLSHDLLEGSLSRCAFASGIKLMDSCPSSVLAFARREHRWIRGDWQLLPWIFSESRINGLSRWKMVDNLRRSLAKPALLFLIAGNAVLFPEQFWISIFFIGFEHLFRAGSLLVSVIWRKLVSPASRLAKIVITEQFSTILALALYNTILLPFRSYIALDAVIRTLYRLWISHKNLLEWQTAEAVDKTLINNPRYYWKSMWVATIPALILMSTFVIQKFSIGSVFWIVLSVLWVLSPWLSWLVSKRKPGRFKKGDTIQIEQMRLTARRTWRYFEDYSTIDNHWLCPDNVQIYPGPKTSDKTSPTNIGLQLLSLLSARDMGYIGLIRLIDRLEDVFETIGSLPKWHGHLYNWYNIRTLQVLYPRYISTVDSGNFVVDLITLKQGLIQLKSKEIIHPASIDGLTDTIHLAGLSTDILKSMNHTSTVADWIRILETLDLSHASLGSERMMSKHESAEENPIAADAEQSATDSEWLTLVQDTCESFRHDIQKLNPNGDLPRKASLLQASEAQVTEAELLLNRIDQMIAHVDKLVKEMDFKHLYDRDYQLFSIGYNESSQTLDSGHYDLLASEARVTSYFAIAQGMVPQKHWFALGRPLTMVKGIPACVSWSGSMFEYLMPNLVMKLPLGSVMQQSCLAAVLYQIAYAGKQNMPWGISESQYYRFDTNSNYQYGPIGVQRLRLQASLKPARVIAPYATMLALGVLPERALDNLDHLRNLDAEGTYGFYEALDYNHPDSTNLREFSLIKCFMAHHQGMSLVAMNNFLNNDIMQRRFHSEPIIQATEALLEEKRAGIMVTLASRGYTINIDSTDLEEEIYDCRVCNETNLVQPLAHVLSNNHYMIMMTSDGAGFSRCDDMVINRWQPETVHEQNGLFIYIRDLTSNKFWSTSYLPTRTQPDDYQAIFSHDKVEFVRKDGFIQTHTSIAISPLKNFEVRRVVLTNRGSQPAMIELTSYQEVVADDYMADELHPAFSKLFIETEFMEDRHMLIASRRKRGPEDKPRFIMHATIPETKLLRPVEFEIDRRSFIGRGGSLAEPVVIGNSIPLSNRAGFSRDTILSLRTTLLIPAGGKAGISFVTGFCTSRSAAMKLAHELRVPHSAADVFKLALTSSKLELKYLNINSRQLNAIQNLVSYLYYSDLATRGSSDTISQLNLGQSGLWRYGISGDHPIILLQVSHLNEMPVIQDVLLAYEYLRINQVKADLVIINEEPHGYSQSLAHRLRELTGNLKIFSYTENKPSLFLLQKSLLSVEEFRLLMAVSRLVLNGRSGLYRPELLQNPKPRRDFSSKSTSTKQLPVKLDIPNAEDPLFREWKQLEYFNGIGGFRDDGKEYEIRLSNGNKTPMPWINVIANERFGFLVSEIGAGYTWADNSRENKLTTWSNDPVLDPVSEAVYIKDVETGRITSPASLVPAQSGEYRVRHGFGYSVFEHIELALFQSMILFVPLQESLKIWLLTIQNRSQNVRNLSIALSVEWVLGVVKSQTAPYIQTQWDESAQILSARNLYNDAHRDHPAYLFCSEIIQSFSGDRKHFFGVGGSIRHPAGLTQEYLDQKTGVGLDPCGVIQITVRLEPGETREIVLGLGQADNLDEASRTARKYRVVETAKKALDLVKNDWIRMLRTVSVRTPDRAMDILANGWLQYQVVSCRLRARAAFYQCGGAIGFRDQLQDVLSLLDVDPAIVRRQILVCSSRQFVEGDVQHWWHPASGLGVRTRISDDMLWLPYVTAAYVEHTGDWNILDEEVSYITGDGLAEDQAERMIQPQESDQKDSVYQHCLRAIDRASHMGIHGLPLMGGGDWNDGMNRVGIGGKGESVWLGWFLYTVIQRFLPAVKHQDNALTYQLLNDLAVDLQKNLEHHAWDGAWYLRAFFDNGVPLGSSSGDECRIDSISQSWAVLSEAAGHIRALTALDSAKRYLVREEDGVSLLLTPPFDKTPNDPGYIKGYSPGMRENGGQYTHAAIWLAMAHAKVGKSNEANQLLYLLNPIHASSSVFPGRYEKEPYVMAADISMGGIYTGKAGWSWYTGSAGWMYQAILHSFLGIKKIDSHLFISPAVPVSFNRFVVEYRFGTAIYEITVHIDTHNEVSENRISIDGKVSNGNSFLLEDDGEVHNVSYHCTHSS